MARPHRSGIVTASKPRRKIRGDPTSSLIIKLNGVDPSRPGYRPQHTLQNRKNRTPEERKAVEQEIAKLLHQYNRLTRLAPGEMPTVAAIEDDLVKFWEGRPAMKGKLTTARGYKSKFKVWIAPKLGYLKLSDLDGPTIQRWINEVTEQSSQGNARTAFGTLTSIIKWARRPASFLHISRPEIDLPPGSSPYSDAAYARGAENLARLRDGGVLVRDREPSFYVYRMVMNGRVQTGVAFAASVAAYQANRIRRHELTRPDKKNDRARNIVTLSAQTGPVLLAYRANASLAELIDAAAARVALQRSTAGAPLASHELFLAVAFPHDEMRILAYNRVVAD